MLTSHLKVKVTIPPVVSKIYSTLGKEPRYCSLLDHKVNYLYSLHRKWLVCFYAFCQLGKSLNIFHLTSS